MNDFTASRHVTRSRTPQLFDETLKAFEKKAERRHEATAGGASSSLRPREQPASDDDGYVKLAHDLERASGLPGAVAAMEGQEFPHEKLASEIDAGLGQAGALQAYLEKVAFTLVTAEAEEQVCRELLGSGDEG